MIAVNPNRVYEYVLEEERGLPPEKQTKFKLGILTVEDEEFCSSLFLQDKGLLASREILRRGLRGWSNFPDESGKEAEFQLDEDGKPSLYTLGRLEAKHRYEIGNAIQARGKLSEDEKKP